MIGIPNLQNSNSSKISGFGKGIISNRTDINNTGKFSFEINLDYNNLTDVPPILAFKLIVDLNESTNGFYKAKSAFQINQYGKQNPTLYISGICRGKDSNNNFLNDSKFWIMLVSHGNHIYDTISFTIIDGKGGLLTYGTGNFTDSSISIIP